MKRLLILALLVLGLTGCTACWEDGGGQDFRIGTSNPCQSSSDPEVQDADNSR